MAMTESNMLSLGVTAPNFALPDTLSGKTLSLDELASEQATVVMFICNHCPFVKAMIKELAAFGADYTANGVSVIAISSNDIDNYPEDSPEKMKALAEAEGFTFPYLYDEDQSVAKAYDAACTPDFYLFDGNRQLVYRGQFDGSRPGNDEAPSGRDLREALDALLSGRPVPEVQRPSIGCNIKWRETTL